MKELLLPDHLAEKIETLYGRMEQDYDQVARQLDFSCEECPDNCCDSYFLHHTYAEWAYLWRGIRQLEEGKQRKLVEWAKDYLRKCSKAQEADERPQVMCPLNEDGLCILYAHRLLVCRTHGVPATMRRPDGKVLNFPGCFRCQEIVNELKESGAEVAHVERTPLLMQLVQVENELLENKRHLYPKVKKSIAEMIVEGPPMIPTPFCER